MAVESVTVRVPRELLTHFQERAQHTRRTVEEELVEALASIVLADDALPSDVAAALAPLDAMSNDALWTTARDSHLSPAAAAHLEELNQKRQRDGLTDEEQHLLATLLHQYERLLLVRAEALAGLKERGRDISTLLEPQAS